jgi:serine/threonine-protein kinase Chk1
MVKPFTYSGGSADIYSLGIMLYEMMFNELPLNKSDPAYIYQFRCLLSGNPEYFKYFWHSKGLPNSEKVDRDLVHLIFSMLNYEPNQRPTISQVLESLWLKGI